MHLACIAPSFPASAQPPASPESTTRTDADRQAALQARHAALQEAPAQKKMSTSTVLRTASDTTLSSRFLSALVTRPRRCLFFPLLLETRRPPAPLVHEPHHTRVLVHEYHIYTAIGTGILTPPQAEKYTRNQARTYTRTQAHTPWHGIKHTHLDCKIVFLLIYIPQAIDEPSDQEV